MPMPWENYAASNASGKPAPSAAPMPWEKYGQDNTSVDFGDPSKLPNSEKLAELRGKAINITPAPTGPIPDAPKPGIIEGVKRGAEQFGVGMFQLAGQAGMGQKPEFKQALAERAQQLQQQGEGTGLYGVAGEILGNPTTYLPLGGPIKAGAGALIKAGAKALPKVSPKLLGALGGGAAAGAVGGGFNSLTAPSTDTSQTLLDRGINTASGTGLGAVLGLAGAGAVAGGQKMLSKTGKLDTAFSDAAKFFKMDFSKAKTDEAIAQEINRATQNYTDKMGSTLWHRAPADKGVAAPGEVAQNMLDNFKLRKDGEKQLWTAAEQKGNRIQADTTKQIKELMDMRGKLKAQMDGGAATENSKHDLALVDRVLNELGAPVQPEQKITERVKEVGQKVRTTEAQRQFAADAAQTSKLETEPTTTMGDKRFSETSQTPVEKATTIDGKVKTTTQNPYSITTRTIKGAAPQPPRQSTAADLVRAIRDGVNNDAYGLASREVKNQIRDVVNDALVDVGKTNKDFSKIHSKANIKTQKNADIYRDDAKAKAMGVDEKTLANMIYKIGKTRQLSTADLQNINGITEKIKTPEDLEFLRRRLSRPQFSMLMRGKNATLMDDINMNVDKFREARPMIEQMYEYSRIPKAKYKPMLDNYEAVAQKMTEAGVSGDVRLNPDISKVQARLRSLSKVLLFGGALHNPKQAIFHGAQMVTPNPTADMLQLRGIRNAATPQNTYSGAATQAGGGLVGSGAQQMLNGIGKFNENSGN